MQQHLDLLKQLGKQAKTEQEQQARAKLKQQQNQTDDVDFAKLVGTVRPIKSDGRIETPRDTSPIRVRHKTTGTDDDTARFYISELDDAPQAPSTFSKNGRGQDDIRRLISGYWHRAGRLDLHGCRRDEAQTLLNDFIAKARHYGVCVEIVHGSGLGSHNFTPVLKNTVRRWLMAHPDVLAYAEPHRHNDGAVWVLLKRLKKPTE